MQSLTKRQYQEILAKSKGKFNLNLTTLSRLALMRLPTKMKYNFSRNFTDDTFRDLLSTVRRFYIFDTEFTSTSGSSKTEIQSCIVDWTIISVERTGVKWYTGDAYDADLMLEIFDEDSLIVCNDPMAEYRIINKLKGTFNTDNDVPFLTYDTTTSTFHGFVCCKSIMNVQNHSSSVEHNSFIDCVEILGDILSKRMWNYGGSVPVYSYIEVNEAEEFLIKINCSLLEVIGADIKYGLLYKVLGSNRAIRMLFCTKTFKEIISMFKTSLSDMILNLSDITEVYDEIEALKDISKGIFRIDEAARVRHQKLLDRKARAKQLKMTTIRSVQELPQKDGPFRDEDVSIMIDAYNPVFTDVVITGHYDKYLDLNRVPYYASSSVLGKKIRPELMHLDYTLEQYENLSLDDLVYIFENRFSLSEESIMNLSKEMNIRRDRMLEDLKDSVQRVSGFTFFERILFDQNVLTKMFMEKYGDSVFNPNSINLLELLNIRSEDDGVLLNGFFNN